MNIIDIDKITKETDKKAMIEPMFNDWFFQVEFKYKSKYKNTKKLRDFVDIICDILWFSDTTKSRIILISDELNNNAIEYWSSKNWTNYMRIKATINENNVDFNLEVEDNWKWANSKTALDMETMRAHQLKLWYFNHDSIRWRWLFLITVKIADRLYFKNSKKWWLIVWVKMNVKNKESI